MSFSGPYFPAFGLNTERYGVSLRIQSECGKIQTRITPNANTFYAVFSSSTSESGSGGRGVDEFGLRFSYKRTLVDK